MVWQFTINRIMGDENSTASALYAPDGTHICALLEPGARDCLPVGAYDIAVLPIGASPVDQEILQRMDPLSYRGLCAIGDRKVGILPPQSVPSAQGVVAAWHVVQGQNGFEVPTDGAFDGKVHGDGFCWLYRSLYLAVENGGARVLVIDRRPAA